MENRELNLNELNEVAGGMTKTYPTFPTGTGPFIPTDPFPFPIPFGPWNKI